MATIFDSEFIDVNTAVLRRITGPLPFNIFIRRGDNTYTKLFPKGESLDGERLTKYEKEKGVQAFFVHHDDYKQYLLYVEQVASRLFQNTSAVSGDEMLYVAKEMIDMTMFELVMNKHVDAKTIGHAVTAMKGCLDVLAKDPKALVKILKMMAKHPYTMKHSVATSIFALMLAKAEKLESEKTLTIVGLGALLHDIGMSMISFDAEDKAELSPDEWKEMRRHPELGSRVLDSIKTLPTEVRTIVLQHHEQPNGSGYPNGMHAKEIYYLSKIVAIADSFAALVSKRPFREEACSPTKALELMNGDRGKFDVALLDRFNKIFLGVRG